MLRKIVTLMALLVILFQVQLVFACEMMKVSGPKSHCCCGDSTPAPPTPKQSSACCELGYAFTTHSNLDEQAAFALPTQPPQLPDLPMALVVPTEWLTAQSARLHQPLMKLCQVNPGHSGTDTYLTTLRLRI